MIWATNIRLNDLLDGRWPLLQARIDNGELQIGAPQKWLGWSVEHLAACDYVGLYCVDNKKWGYK